MTPEEHDKLIALMTTVEAIKDDLESIDKRLGRIEAQTNRWKGGIVVLLAVGGIIGWAADRIPVWLK